MRFQEITGIFKSCVCFVFFFPYSSFEDLARARYDVNPDKNPLLFRRTRFYTSVDDLYKGTSTHKPKVSA